MKTSGDHLILSATDLSNHLGCAHLTQLNRLLAFRQISAPVWTDPALVVLAQRGEEHEERYVDSLRQSGLSVTSLLGQGTLATLEAMKKGWDAIVQAELSEGGWMGRADILKKVETPSALGNWSYEVQDTKLSRNTRAGAILQLALYCNLLSNYQQRDPENMYIVKPGKPFDIEAYRYADFRSYFRLIKKSLRETVDTAVQETYPNPVPQCDICRWWKNCDGKRRSDDHLSLVANIRSMHIGELNKAQINTLEQLATAKLPLFQRPERGTEESFLKVHHQARLQFDARNKNELVYELLPHQEGLGLSRLPTPSPGDIYFDIEGDPFYGEGGLEYLLGFAFRDESGMLQYDKIWARNASEEKKAFDTFMTFVMNRMKKYPDLHIYHFSPYEPSAVKRLTGRYAIHEDNLDTLLRGEKFTDLFAVIREGVRAGVEHYSLKDLEKFTRYSRVVDLPKASAARRSVEFALELNEQDTLKGEILTVVEQYNADDCLATEALHTWVEKLRDELTASGADVKRPVPEPEEPSEETTKLQLRAKSLFEGLTAGLPEDRSKWTSFDHAKWLLANEIDYFRREYKSAWWEFFRLHEMGFEDLLEERKGLAGLKFIQEIKQDGRSKLPVHRYSFPPQETGIDEDDILHEAMGIRVGTVHAISIEDGTIDIKKTKESQNIHPVCVHQEEVVTIEPLASAIFDIADTIIFDGIESTLPPYRATKDLLLKRSPRLKDGGPGELMRENEDVVDAAIRISLNLNGSILGIQGPPGSGKTYTGAMMIINLASQGKRVGVTAPSHKVIRNLFNKVLELSAKYNIPVSLVHKPKEKSELLPPGLEEIMEAKPALRALNERKVVGGTAWLWANNDAREILDYLFVDEAGQMSLAHVLAASRSAKNVVLLGDPQQLEQPQKASHPEGADIAALSHLLDGKKVMPPDKGLFLGTTRRLHPAITAFTREMFYENDARMRSLAGLEKQGLHGSTPFSGAGLFFVPATHEQNNQNKSDEEVKAVTVLVQHLTGGAVRFTDATETTGVITHRDIVVVAPYNAQVEALKEAIPECSIGTVDKFQGQEAPIVIYSMTSTSATDAPRGMNFLYNPNRLNVATSRAKCCCIIVASPELMKPDCRTVDQVRWANALCRYREMAKEIALEALSL